MAKLKTNSAASKRFWVSGSGKIRRKKAGKRHLLTHKDKNRKRNLVQSANVHQTDVPRVKLLLCI
jgi:large subunit ribosomal protein L35